jgi:hypothetical protein
MQPTALTISAESQAHLDSLRSQLISEWLFKFALAFQAQGREPAVTEETAPMMAALWSEGLSDVPTEALEPAFKATLRTSRFFPTVADIRSHVESAEDSRVEDEWQNVLEYALRYVYPDIGVRGPAPLPPDIDHAVRAAGGLHYLESCPTDELQWAKKRFIEDLTRQRKRVNIAAYLPESPLGRMLRANAPRVALPSAPPAPALASGRIEAIADRIRNAPPQPSYSLHAKRDNSAFVAWQDKHAERDPGVAKYLRKHGVPKTPFQSEPEFFDSMQHESAGSVVPESLVSGAGE